MTEYNLQIDYHTQTEWDKSSMWLEMALGAIGGGLFIVSLFFGFNLGVIVAFLTVVAGKGLLLLSDLGRPERFVKIMGRPSTWISKGSWGFMLFIVTGALYIVPFVLPPMGWVTMLGTVGKPLGLIAAILAVFIMIYDAFFLSEAKGVSFWVNGSMPVVFATSAAVGGIGAFMLLAQLGGLKIGTETLAAVNAVALVMASITLYSYIVSSKNAAGGALFSAERLTKGNLSGAFWGGAVGAGIIIPLLVTVCALLGVSQVALLWPLVGIAEMIGVIALRYCVLKAGVYSPVI